MKSYYGDKVEILKDIFGSKNIVLESDSLLIDNRKYPIINDVIILSDPVEYTDYVRNKPGLKIIKYDNKLIQYSFGEEWKKYSKILPEHSKEFYQYFDIVDLNKLNNLRVCDLGCGNGRWSWFLKDICREIILVDFSDAIFIARKNLRGAKNCLFFMCDLKKLPFKNDFADFLFCLGVLHHLPTPCLKEIRSLRKYASTLLVFLYYALDNRPVYYRFILNAVTLIRKLLSRVKNPFFRKVFSSSGTYFIYLPMVYLGHLLEIIKLGSYIPLYDFYRSKSISRIKQDVYDRFFTSIEQRVTRNNILKLKDIFSKVIISDNLPYWHFLCRR